MKKPLLYLALALSLSGCAGFTAFVGKNAATFTAVSLVAGTIAASEQAVVSALEIKDKLDD